LTHLKRLWLYESQATDEGLTHFCEMSDLEYFAVYSPHVTPEGVKKLQEALPNCKIEY